MMKNNSGLRPLGHAVLVKPYEPQKKDSLIVLPETAKERTLMVEVRAVVVEIGPEAWFGERQPRAKVGDKVLISKFAGVMARGTKDDVAYRLVNDNDIYCEIEVE
ncbi:MAG: co-chaperone GroES [Terriglobia bacterium]